MAASEVRALCHLESGRGGGARGGWVRRGTASNDAAAPRQQVHEEQHNRDDEQHVGNVRGDGGNARRAQNSGNQRDDEKYERIVEHQSSSPGGDELLSAPLQQKLCRMDLLSSSSIAGPSMVACFPRSSHLGKEVPSVASEWGDTCSMSTMENTGGFRSAGLQACQRR